MAYRFISKYRNYFGVRWLLRRMNIHVNAYYNHLKHHKKGYQVQKDRIHDQIKKIYHETGGILGHQSMRIFLKRQGIVLSKTTVHKYMNKELKLICICRRKRLGYKKRNAHKLFPNLLNQDFNVTGKNKVWCADFTYIKLTNGLFRYNCSIIDLHERCVVGTQTAKWMTSKLAIETLKKAIASQDIDTSKLIFHTDQGVRFTSLAFTDFVTRKRLVKV